MLLETAAMKRPMTLGDILVLIGVGAVLGGLAIYVVRSAPAWVGT
jgi:hypothetical protein